MGILVQELINAQQIEREIYEASGTSEKQPNSQFIKPSKKLQAIQYATAANTIFGLCFLVGACAWGLETCIPFVMRILLFIPQSSCILTVVKYKVNAY